MVNNTYLDLITVDCSKSQKARINTVLKVLKIAPYGKPKNDILYLLFATFQEVCSDMASQTNVLNFVTKDLKMNLSTEVLKAFEESIKQNIPIEEKFNFIDVTRNKRGNISKTTLKPTELKDYLIDTFGFCLIEGSISYFNGRCYQQVTGKELQRLLNDIKDLFRVSTFNAENFIKQNLNNLTEYNANQIQDNHITCIDKKIIIDPYNLDTSHITIKEHTSDVICLNDVNVEIGDCNTFEEFKKQNYDSRVDQAIDLWCDNDKDLRANLEEFVGSCLYRLDVTRTAFVLNGGASCGKSTFCDLLSAMLKEDNCSNCSLFDIGDKYRCSEIQGKRLNWIDDIQTDNIKAEIQSILKRIISNEVLHIEWKGIQGIEYKPRIRIVMTCNKLPYFSDVGLWDRLRVIPFKHKFIKSNYRNVLIKDQKALNYLFCLGIEGVLRILQRADNKDPCFTPCKSIELETKSVKEKTDHVYEYADLMKQTLIDNAKSNRVSCKENASLYTVQGTFEHFYKWADENKYYQRRTKPTKPSFIETIRSVTGLTVKPKADLYIRDCRKQYDRFVLDKK